MRLIRITLTLAASLLVAPLVAGAEDSRVEISHNRVSPEEVSIQRGETVTFVNTVNMPGGHSVVADDGSFASPALGKNESWDHTFDGAGTFGYHLEEHPDTRGVISVQ